MPEPGATAFAHDQTGIARERQAGGILATDQAEHSLGASHAHFPGVGTYGRQRWCVVLGVSNVVESDDRYKSRPTTMPRSVRARVAPIATTSL